MIPTQDRGSVRTYDRRDQITKAENCKSQFCWRERLTNSLRHVNITVAGGIVKSESNNICSIREGVIVSQLDPLRKATVTQAFTIQLFPVQDGFVATSGLSDIYELEATRGSAIRSYLSSLLDELLWLEEQKESLSDALYEELERIKNHLAIG